MAEFERQTAEADPRLGYLETFLGPNGWREPMVWLLAGGWLIYGIWGLLIVLRGSEYPNFLGLSALFLGTLLYQWFVPNQALEREVDRRNLADRSSQRERRIRRVVIGLALAVSWGAGVVLGWDVQAVRLAVVVVPGALYGWGLHAGVERRRTLRLDPIPPREPSRFVDLMRHDR